MPPGKCRRLWDPPTEEQESTPGQFPHDAYQLPGKKNGLFLGEQLGRAEGCRQGLEFESWLPLPECSWVCHLVPLGLSSSAEHHLVMTVSL